MPRSADEVFQRMLDLLLDKDMDGVADLWAPEGVAEFPFATAGAPTRLVGREAVRDYLSGYPELYDVTGFPSVMSHRTRDPATAVVEFTAVGRTVATGNPYEMSYVVILTVREGRIVAYRDYWSPVQAARARGDLNGVVDALREEVSA